MEGIGDPEPGNPGGHRGWADRVVEVLSRMTEQIEPALALHPDLITFAAGGNDVIRPGTDPDAIASLFDSSVARLRSDGATVVVFTGVDVGFSPPRTWRGARSEDLSWAREYLVPWVLRRIRHQSSGDHLSAKRPDAMPFVRVFDETARALADEEDAKRTATRRGRTGASPATRSRDPESSSPG